MIWKTLKCSFCKNELFEEEDAKFECEGIYVVRRLPQFSIHCLDGSVRCVLCDTIIGHDLTDNKDYIMIWAVEIEKEENHEEDEDKIKNIIGISFAAIFIDRFSKV